jgi:hypothetical protein
MPERVEVVRLAGLLLTLAGVFLVAPSGTVHLAQRWRQRSAQAGRAARSRLATSWVGRTPLGRWLRSPAAHILRVSGEASGGLTVTATATVKTAWLSHSAPVERRIDQLREKLDGLGSTLDSLANSHRQELDSLKALLDERTADLRGQIEEMSQRLDHALIEATEVDASALPWVLLGVALQAWPERWPWLPLWLSVPVLAWVVSEALWRMVQAVQRERARGKEAPA